MHHYEAACIFKADEEIFEPSKLEILTVLKGLGATTISEHDMGVRTLAHSIKKEVQGHYLVFDFHMDPDMANQIESKIKYFENLLRILVIRKD